MKNYYQDWRYVHPFINLSPIIRNHNEVVKLTWRVNIRFNHIDSHNRLEIQSKCFRGGPRRVSIYLYLWIQSSSWTKVLVLDSFAGACLLLCITSQVSDVAHGPHFCFFAINFLFKNHVIQYFTNFTCRFCSEFLRNLPNGLRI